MMTDAATPSPPTEQRSIAVLERLIEVAHPASVFGEAVTVGDSVVITAAEVTLGVGFAFGGGGGSGILGDDEPARRGHGSGGGGGGGGRSRPVAAIVVGPNGVTVTPIVDRTRIAIAALALVGTLAAVFGKRQRDR